LARLQRLRGRRPCELDEDQHRPGRDADEHAGLAPALRHGGLRVLPVPRIFERKESRMSASSTKLRFVLLAACALALAAIAVPGASAATSCDFNNPCLPQGLGFTSNLPGEASAQFVGSFDNGGVLYAENSAAAGVGIGVSGVRGHYTGTGAGAGDVGDTACQAAFSDVLYGLGARATPG